MIFCDGKIYCFCGKYRASINYMLCSLCEIPIYFWNYKNDLRKNKMDPVFMLRYRNKLFPFLCKCYVINKPSIAYFSRHFFKIYDSEDNIQQDVSLLDLDILL